MALGATARQIVKMIVSEAAVMTALGTVIGLGLAVFLGMAAAKFLYGVSGLDPWTFVIIPIALAAVALFASWLPARRAARTNPMLALRCE
jgi:putative ABC transport system permease protein